MLQFFCKDLNESLLHNFHFVSRQEQVDLNSGADDHLVPNIAPIIVPENTTKSMVKGIDRREVYLTDDEKLIK